MKSEFDGLRVLVVHDWLATWAGAERVLAEIMNVVPHADLVVGAVSPDLRDRNDVTRRARETWLRHLPGAHRNYRWTLPLHYPAFSALKTRDYDLVVSSANVFAKAVRPFAGRPHVSYCHTPARYLWDMGDVYRERLGTIASLALRVGSPWLRRADRRAANSVTQFVSNSRFVQDRIRRAYGRESVVVYPPVTRKPANPRQTREDFLLVLGRMVPYKRVDLAIAAAEHLGVSLVVAGDGPERRSLERIAGRCTTFVGEVDEATAGDLLERCRAFVFCAEEDFGIAPVEANAHGAPVIGFGSGALTESMVPGTTAVLFARQCVEDVEAAIASALGQTWNRDAIRENAKRFSPERFREEFAGVLRASVR